MFAENAFNFPTTLTKKIYCLRVFNSEMHHHRDEIKTTMETLIRKSSDSNWNLWLGIYLAQVCMYKSISSWWREFVLLNASFMLLLKNRSRKKRIGLILLWLRNGILIYDCLRTFCCKWKSHCNHSDINTSIYYIIYDVLMARKDANKPIWLTLKIVNIQAFKRSTWMWLFVNYASRLFREIEKYVWTLLNKYYFKRTIRASSRWQCKLFLRQVLQVKRFKIFDVAVKKHELYIYI